MEVKQYALDPALGMLQDCKNMCGEPARMEMIEEPSEVYKAKFKCTGCGVEEYKTYKSYTLFTSLHFSY